jgi:hypothetical protein
VLDNGWAECLSAFLLGRGGDRIGAQEHLAAVRARARASFVSPTALALADLGVGETRRASEMLERARANHDPLLVMLAGDPLLESTWRRPELAHLDL